MSLTARARKEKGKRGERDIVNRLKSYLGDKLCLNRNLVQARNGGSDIIGLKGFSVEVKNHSSVSPSSLDKWFEQCCSQAQVESIELGEQLIPLLWFKWGRRWLCQTRLDNGLAVIMNEEDAMCFIKTKMLNEEQDSK